MPKPEMYYNPVTKEIGYTKRAKRLIRQGVLVVSGRHYQLTTGSLEFQERLRRAEEVEHERKQEREADEEGKKQRGGVYYWNGEDHRPWAMWPPGCRRS